MAGKKYLSGAHAAGPTRDAVAKRAGVSSATVSRALNDPGSVSDATRKRVLGAAKALGYTLDKRASALRRGGSGTLVFASRAAAEGETFDRYYSWFYADIIQAVQQAVEPSAYSLSLFTFRSPRDVASLARRLPEGILLRNEQEPAVMRAFSALGVPTVVCRQGAGRSAMESAVIDEREGGRLAAEALLAAGCRRPLHITGGLAQNFVCRDRYHGFCGGLAPLEPLLIDGRLGIQGGLASGAKAAQLVKEGRVDGIFVVNDLTAVGVVQALLAAGVRIPEDVRLIGYDRLPFIDVLPIRLATLDIGFGRLYGAATRALLARMAGGAAVKITLAPVLVGGESINGS